MPCVLHLVVGRTRQRLELILSEEVQPPRLLFVNANTLLVHIVERREQSRGDVRQLVDMSLVLHDGVGECLENAALRDVADAARLHDADGEVGDAILFIVDRRTQFKRQRTLALNERHAVRDDRVLPVRLLIDIDVRDLGELVDKEVTLVAQVVCLAAVRLREHDVLVELCDLLREIIELAQLDADLVILCRDLGLQLLGARLDAVDEIVALRNDCRA